MGLSEAGTTEGSTAPRARRPRLLKRPEATLGNHRDLDGRDQLPDKGRLEGGHARGFGGVAAHGRKYGIRSGAGCRERFVDGGDVSGNRNAQIGLDAAQTFQRAVTLPARGAIERDRGGARLDERTRVLEGRRDEDLVVVQPALLDGEHRH